MSEEQCPHCDFMNEVDEFKIYICDECGGDLLACSQCEYVIESTSWCLRCPLIDGKSALTRLDDERKNNDTNTGS